MKTSIIIPTYQPGVDTVVQLEERLWQQSLVPTEVIVIDSSSTDGSFDAWSNAVMRQRIEQKDFNHGATRNLAALHAQGEVLVFLTQDAFPADGNWLGELVEPLRQGVASAAYSRQVPREGASPAEQFARLKNYPAESSLRCRDTELVAVRKNFFSNVSSAVLASAFEEVGRFPEDVILNEDMVLAARLLEAGHCIAYVAESLVVHSHDYSLAAQFKRYFDIGVALSRGGTSLNSSGTQREGFSFLREQLAYIGRTRQVLPLAAAVAEAGAKYLGFRLGKAESLLPLELKKSISMNPQFWVQEQQAAAARESRMSADIDGPTASEQDRS